MTSAAADGLGPFFASDTHPASAPAPSPWRPMIELVDQPDVLMGRVLAVRGALAAQAHRPGDEVELRVAASVTQLGLVSRLIAVSLAALVRTGAAPDLRLSQLWWRNELGGPYPLSVAPRPSGDATDVRDVIDGPVRQLTEAVMDAVAVSPRVVWGNVESTVNSAAGLVIAADPTASARTRAIADALMAAVGQRREPVGTGAAFRRDSCCLIYRAALSRGERRVERTALCGDCVLA